MGDFNWVEPDYASVMARRIAMLRKIRDPETGAMTIAVLRAHYRLNPWQFVEDWGVTYDPRNIERGLPAFIPFLPFERQIGLMKWIVASWQSSQDGLVPKSRDMGASWCAIALSCTLCLFNQGMSIGFGSRKEEYVDGLGNPKALFPKARIFMEYVPREFRGSWQVAQHGNFMRILFPDSNSVISGEAGDNIGRGDRVGIYFVDEAAHLARPQLAEASLSATTNCRIDMSSVNGMANPFAEKAHSWPEDRIYAMHWRHDPRKTEAWRAKLEATKDPVVIAQEYDINYAASVSGVVIPNDWVQAAIDAHLKLGIEPTGVKRGGLDVADEGKDLNAFAGRHGILLYYVEPWSGKGSDIFATTEKAHDISEAEELEGYRYDADGLGAGVKGDARQIQEKRGTDLKVTPFRGSGAPIRPDERIEQVDEDARQNDDRTNKDYFANAKAQAWWALRMRFLRTFRAVTLGQKFDPDNMISISSKIPKLVQLTAELSQPTYSENGAGKLLIDKAPDGSRSPNLADAVMIVFAPTEERRGFFD